MTVDLDAQAHELVERTCSEQGLPVVVDDDRTLDRVAAIVRSAKSAPSLPGKADGGARSAEPMSPASPQAAGRRGSTAQGRLGAASIASRFWTKVDRADADECWFWKGAKVDAGYGSFWRDGKSEPAHCVAYELEFGAIPDGLQLDHTCHTKDASCAGGKRCPHRACVNPAHLEAVTCAENLKRGHWPNAAKTQCPHGHPYDEANTRYDAKGNRLCKECGRADARRRARGLPAPSKRRAS